MALSAIILAFDRLIPYLNSFGNGKSTWLPAHPIFEERMVQSRYAASLGSLGGVGKI